MSTPRLSVVVAGSRPQGPPAELLEQLGPALADGTVEVLVATAARGAAIPALAGVRLLTAEPGTTIPRLRAMGVAAARAPVVALTEDFCVPVAGWVEAHVSAHAAREAVAIGGPVTRRAGTSAQWALTFCEYGRFFHPAREGRVDDLPGINTSYKVARLPGPEGTLPHDWQEVSVHAALRARGEELWLAPAAVMADAGTATLGHAARALFHHGRLYSGQRSRQESAMSRLRRLLVAPLVPAVLWARMRGPITAAGLGRTFLRTTPWTLILLVSWALGEAVGAVRGPGDSAGRWI